MKLKVINIKFNIENTLVVFLFVLILSPIVRNYFNSYIVCYSFIIFHECAHMLVAGLFGDKINRINIMLCGMNAEIKIKNKLHPKWLVVYFAGPIANVILAAFFYNIQMVRDINIALGIINLLPIYPLDGFNILNILLNWFIPKYKSQKLLQIIQNVELVFIIIIGIIILIYLKNPSIVLFSTYIFCIKNYSKNM